MARASPIGVDDEFPPRQTGIPVGAAFDEPARGVDEGFKILV